MLPKITAKVKCAMNDFVKNGTPSTVRHRLDSNNTLVIMLSTTKQSGLTLEKHTYLATMP